MPIKSHTGEYNLTPPPSLGGKINKKTEIREDNSKLISKRRNKKGGEEKNSEKNREGGRKKKEKESLKLVLKICLWHTLKIC